MKRRRASVAVLTMIGGLTMLSAQEIKFDGYFNSGLGFVTTNRQVHDPGKAATESRAADPYWTAFGVDSEQWGYRFRLNAAAVNEAKTAGFKLRLQGQAKNDKDTSVTPLLTIPTASGWLSFFDEALILNGGIINDTTWAMGGIFDDDAGEGLGGLIKVSPVKGLDLGLGIYTISSLGSGDGNRLARGLDKNTVAGGNAKYVVNLGCTMPDMFKVVAIWRHRNEAGTDAAGDLGRDESSKLILGARVLAVKNLTAVIEAELDNLQDFEEVKAGKKNDWGDTVTDSEKYSGKVNLYESFGYKLEDIGPGDLGAGLKLAQYISMKTEIVNGDNRTGPGLWFNPWVSYGIGNIVPRLDFVYMIGGKIDGSDNDGEGKYYRDGYVPTYFARDWVMTIRPSVTFNAGKAFVEIGDAVNFENSHTEKYFGSAGVGAKDRKDGRFTNIVYVDFKWSF
jgi:hypothetical protein